MKSALVLVSIVLALARAALAADSRAPDEIPALLPIPLAVAVKHPNLQPLRDSLVAKRQALRSAIENHAAKCRLVEEGSAEDAACLTGRARLSTERARHIDESKAFNAAVNATAEAAIAEAAIRIGAAGEIAGEVSIVRADGRRVAVTPGTILYLNDAVDTGPTGRVRIELKDETVFTIGPKSSMVLDTFVYDPATGAGKLSARITKGVFRFVTGIIGRRRPSDVQINGPVGCFCIRGTDFEAEVKLDESGYLKVFSGEVVLKNKKTGVDSTVPAGRIISFDAAGRVTGPRPF